MKKVIIKVVENSPLFFIENYIFINTRVFYLIGWCSSIADGLVLIALLDNLYCIYK